MSVFEPRCEIDGAPATAAQLAHVARVNHGHFTSLQLCDGGVRGLDLHLTRLRDATTALYGTALDVAQLRTRLRHALRGIDNASVRITMFAPEWNLAAMQQPARVASMIHVLPPAVATYEALRLRTVEHERFLPQIKHVATFALLESRAQAQRDGYDDALFVNRHGHVSEGTVWNIAFRDGDGVVLPEAPQLDGITLQLLQHALAQRGIACERRVIHRDTLASFRGAFITNASTAGQPVARIDGVQYAQDGAFMQTILRCYDSLPLQAL